jgi:hypothetical protein
MGLPMETLPATRNVWLKAGKARILQDLWLEKVHKAEILPRRWAMAFFGGNLFAQCGAFV